MPSLAVINAVHARIDAGFTQCPRLEISTTDGLNAPADGSAYLILPVWVSTENPITVGAPGSNVNEESGAFHIALYTPSGAGIYTARAWIDQLKALFRQAQFAGITILSFGSDAITTDATDGNYFVSSFSVAYYYHL